MKKNIGIWLDSEKALIIDQQSDKIETIASEMEHYNLGGGTKTKTPFGTQYPSSDKKLEERKKHQMKKYFENITKQISNAENIAIFGPGETKTAFKKMIENHPDIQSKLRIVESASNKLTENQLKEWVRNFYAE